jgi:hypothetical protein
VEWRCSSTHSELQHEMAAGGQLHCPLCYTVGKRVRVPVEQAAVCVPELVRTPGRRGKSLAVGGIEATIP